MFSVLLFVRRKRRKQNGAPRRRERTEGERPVSGPKNSDGKPCSGVRGDQRVSTDLPCTGADRTRL